MEPFPTEAVGLLLDWYRYHARPLPWRENKDPYRVLVSEIMLQQTRAETVKPYFARFLDRLPTLADLAGCPEDVLLKLWEGLGYYSRVRNLQKAARAVMERYGGVIPADFDALLTLPGVGRYTAGAVASIAYDMPVPAVDGNVLRVVARLTGDSSDVMLASTKSAVEAALAPAVPTPGAGDFTQSLIELGALVCLPGEPACANCPVRLLCRAHREGREKELPVRGTRAARRLEQMTVLVLLLPPDGDGEERVVIRRRPDGGLLGGLYEFPHIPGHPGGDGVAVHLGSLGLSPGEVTPLGPARHLFTHVEWQMEGYAVQRPPDSTLPEGWLAVRCGEIRTDYAIPSAFSAYRSVLFPNAARKKRNDGKSG